MRERPKQKPKSLEERIAEAKARERAAQARLAALQYRANTVERKRDTRRKILLGSLVLDRLKYGAEPTLLAWLQRQLPGFLDAAATPAGRKRNRELFAGEYAHLLDAVPPKASDDGHAETISENKVVS